MPSPAAAVDEIIERAQRGGVVETRLGAAEWELRSGVGTEVILDGYATVYEWPYRVGGSRGFTETLRSGAAAESVESDDIVLLLEHEGLPLARTKSGTLVLRSDENGVAMAASLDTRSPNAMSVISAVERGDLDGMSVGFIIPTGGNQWNRSRTDRSITKIALRDVTLTRTPANPATIAQVRSGEPVTTPRVGRDFAAAVAASLKQ